MKLITGEKGKIIAYILIGNGVQDLRIFKAIVQKLDGLDRGVKWPQQPRGETGLTVVIRGIAVLMNTRMLAPNILFMKVGSLSFIFQKE